MHKIIYYILRFTRSSHTSFFKIVILVKLEQRNSNNINGNEFCCSRLHHPPSHLAFNNNTILITSRYIHYHN